MRTMRYAILMILISLFMAGTVVAQALPCATTNGADDVTCSTDGIDFDGQGGADILVVADGTTVGDFHGGNGKDTLYGADGEDRNHYGDAGNDAIFGGGGYDAFFYGGLGADTGWHDIALIFLVGQMALIWRQVTRGARYHAAVAISRDLVPPLSQPDPWAHRVGGPGGPQYPIDESDQYGVSL